GKETQASHVLLNELGREKAETILVSSMHERKVEMASRAGGFVGLPGGFGTFEEILEVITWTQIGIHDKPVVLLNVLGFYEPLRGLIKNALHHAEHATYDWGKAALEAIDGWEGAPWVLFDWTKKMGGTKEALTLS
ncbi:hypothetical protein EWM64_g9606, partial [Hericium alpestre]